MYCLDNGVDVDPEVKRRAVNNVDGVSQGIGYTDDVACFNRGAQFAGFFLMKSHLRTAPDTATVGCVRMAWRAQARAVQDSEPPSAHIACRSQDVSL